jgi:hypothetical protein
MSRRLALRLSLTLSLAASVVAPARAEGLKIDRLRAADGAIEAPLWPRWQARLGVASSHVPSRAFPAGSLDDNAGPRTAALLGDYYFTGSGFDAKRVGGGLRATTGWLYGGSLALDAGGTATGSAVSFWRGTTVDDARARHAGYIGIGYTGLLARFGLGFSADLGLIGSPLSPTNQRLDSDYTIRDIRLAPTVRLGVSYAF